MISGKTKGYLKIYTCFEENVLGRYLVVICLQDEEDLHFRMEL
jgi:hypothetical protein